MDDLPEPLSRSNHLTAHHRPMTVDITSSSQLADLELAHDEAIALFHDGNLDQADEVPALPQ